MKSHSLAAMLLAATSTFAIANTAFAGDQTGSVLLSSGGLAQIVKHVPLKAGDTVITLDVPTDQADDVLKSLVVSDPDGSVAGVTIDGANAVAEAFKRLPFKREDLVSTAALAAAMTGYAATIDDGAGHSESGVILGVTQVPRATSGQPIDVPAATLKRDDGAFSQVLLGPGATVKFTDASVQAKVEAAMAAVRQTTDANFRTVRIVTTGQGERTVDLSYVVAAPVWKAAYRIVPGTDGKYRVQGWAVLENGTGDDWTNVSLTLSSSSPVALRQRLMEMVWRDRREVPVMLPGGDVRPIVDDVSVGAQAPAAMDYAEAAPAPMADAATMAEGGMLKAAAPPRMMPSPSGGPATTASESETAITFTLPEPVKLKAGETLTVPIIDADFNADLVSMWQPDAGSRHPVAAIYLANTSQSSVPPGIFTVYGEEGYLGDAQVNGIPPGEKRFAAFAADAKTTVTQESVNDSTVSAIKAGNGALTITSIAEQTTTYHITAPKDGDRTVMIDHARLAGYEASTPATVVADEPGRLRLSVKVEAGKTADVPVKETTTAEQVIALADSDADSLVYWASTKGIDPKIATRLKAIADLKTRLAGFERAVEHANDEVSRKSAEQERIRANLQAVPETSDSAKGYLTKLDKAEKAIEAAETERAANQDRADKAQAELDEAIATL